MTGLSVVIPALNAEARLPACLAALEEAEGIERVVVDGRSSDGTAAAAVQSGARVLEAERGRGNQLAAGAEAAEGEWLLFLHADTVLSPDWWQAVRMFMAAEGNKDRAAVFRFALVDPAPAARRLERIVRWRTRVLGLPYGDQGLLISRALYRSVGGYRRIPIMEDVALVRRIGRRRLVMLDIAAVTSAARYRRGYLRRSARNLVCLSLYFAGVPPRMLKRLYG